jgi:hypothetical protein
MNGGTSQVLAAASELTLLTGCFTESAANEFYYDYLLAGKPVILRGLAKDWNVRTAWTKENLKKTYGDMSLTSGPIPYSNHFDMPDQKLSLADYVEAMATVETTDDEFKSPYYVFEDPIIQTMGNGQTSQNTGNSALTKALRSDYEWMPHFIDFDEEKHPLSKTMFPIAQQFYLGGIGTGVSTTRISPAPTDLVCLSNQAPLHYHGDAWNVCAYGSRRWFLFPPSKSLYSKIPMKEWVEHDYPKLKKEQKPLECMQRAGESVCTSERGPFSRSWTITLCRRCHLRPAHLRARHVQHPGMRWRGRRSSTRPTKPKWFHQRQHVIITSLL